MDRYNTLHSDQLAEVLSQLKIVNHDVDQHAFSSLDYRTTSFVKLKDVEGGYVSSKVQKCRKYILKEESSAMAETIGYDADNISSYSVKKAFLLFVVYKYLLSKNPYNNELNTGVQNLKGYINRYLATVNNNSNLNSADYDVRLGSYIFNLKNIDKYSQKDYNNFIDRFCPDYYFNFSEILHLIFNVKPEVIKKKLTFNTIGRYTSMITSFGILSALNTCKRKIVHKRVSKTETSSEEDGMRVDDVIVDHHSYYLFPNLKHGNYLTLYKLLNLNQSNVLLVINTLTHLGFFSIFGFLTFIFYQV